MVTVAHTVEELVRRVEAGDVAANELVIGGVLATTDHGRKLQEAGAEVHAGGSIVVLGALRGTKSAAKVSMRTEITRAEVKGPDTLLTGVAPRAELMVLRGMGSLRAYEYAAAMGAAGRARVERDYDERRVAAAYLDVLEGIVSRR